MIIPADWLHIGALSLGLLILVNSALTILSLRYYLFIHEKAFLGKLSKKEKAQNHQVRDWQRYGGTLRLVFLAALLIAWGLGLW